ncbi:hypothetical protein FRC09_020974 [Ceratobasidium sp. 395]|nr:hypothetical protein FRC09_020974 [Ceratobasidium sp. 395]
MPPHVHNPPMQPSLHFPSNQPQSPSTSCPSTSSPASISMDLRTPSTTSTSSSATDDQLNTTLAAMYALGGEKENARRAKEEKDLEKKARQECEKWEDKERRGREAKEKGVKEDTERRERGEERIKQRGNLLQLGELSKSAGLLFGLTRALDQEASKPRYTTRPRANSSIAMFAVPNTTRAPSRVDGCGGASNRKGVDPGPDGSPPLESGSTREQLNLSPRVKPMETEAKKDKDGGVSGSTATPVLMSDAKAREKVKKVVKAYLSTENLEETIVTLETLPIEYRYIFVDAMAVAALNGDDKLVTLIEKLFATARERCVCSAEAFERGLFPVVEMANDISTGVPKAYEWLARLMRAAGVKRIQVKKMAAKIVVRGEVWIQPKDLLMQEFDKAVLEGKEREERERREKEEKEEVEREARERAEREAREKEELERLAREEKERIAKEQVGARTRVEEEARSKVETEVTDEAVAAENNTQDHEPLSFGHQPRKGPTYPESSTSDESWERNNLAQHDPPEWAEDAEERIQACLSTKDIGQAVNIFQKTPECDRATFVGKCIAAAFDGGNESVLAIQQLFNAAYNGRICAAKSFEQGFLAAVDSADETSMDVPRTYEWLARLMHGAGLTKARVERMAERIVVVGEPRLEPKYLLVYEFEKLVI